MKKGITITINHLTMSYLLHPLEKVIDQLNSISPSVSKEKEIETCREEIRKQCLRFARQLIECSVTCTSSKKLSIQIRLYQSRIIEWVNLLTSFSSDNSCHSNETHQRVVSYLTEILVFLQRHFQASFDTNQSLPVVCYQKHCTIISKRMAVIKERFQQSKLKPHLIDTIFHPFTDFINAKVAHYSFMISTFYMIGSIT